MAVPLAIGSAILGGVQLIGGLATALNLGDRPRYSMTPEMRQSASRANYMAGMGFLPEERAAAMQGAASTQAAGMRRAEDMGGGNLARSLGGSMAANNLNFQNQLASQDAALRRQNIRYADRFSQEAQRISDANTAADMNFRMQEERAVGQAIQSGFMNLAGFGNLNAVMGYKPTGGVVPEGGYRGYQNGAFVPTSEYSPSGSNIEFTGGQGLDWLSASGYGVSDVPGLGVQHSGVAPVFTSPQSAASGPQSFNILPQEMRLNVGQQKGWFYGDNSIVPNLY